MKSKQGVKKSREFIKNNVPVVFQAKSCFKGSLFLFTSQTSCVPTRESPPTLLTLFVFVLKFLLLVLSVM